MSAEQAAESETGEYDPNRSSRVLRNTARSSALSFAGSMVSAIGGFGLSLILGRMIGPEGNGVVFQMISVFMIVGGVAKLGLDTTCTWLLPRLAVDGRADVRRATWLLLGGSLMGGLAAGVVVFAIAPFLSSGRSDLLLLMQASAVFTPIASVGTVALAATRGLGGIRPYVLIGSIGLPTGRLAAIAAAMAVSASALLAGFIWLALLLVATAVSVVAVARRLRPYDRPGAATRSRREITRQISSYSGPRLASSIMEQVTLWQDVLIVGLIAGPVAAGIYGVVSRLGQAGFIPSTSMRIVVAPEFSRMLHQRRLTELSELYQRTSQWIALMSVPIYAIFVLFARPVLGLFGSGFDAGELALIIASVGALVWTSVGNIQSLLLMSGLTGWAAVIKFCVLVVSLGLLLLLVPIWGIEGAACAWSASMIVDALLATIIVHRGVGIRLHFGSTLLALVVAVGTTAVPALVARLVFGDTMRGLVIGGIAAVVVYAAVLFFLRERFALDNAIALFQRRRTPTPR
ncbi:oligosaccharide flippase family protein [Propionicimonas sp.]|uniref:oligosaccharide flippase family protein n=1 Tax=Propionicimonas sp. TaxID=1955623 RepID=UPI0039E60CE3